MKRDSQEYIRFLEYEGFNQTFPKDNARILFNDKNGKITDLIVEEFKNPDKKQYLYEKYSSDFGNCLGDWIDWTFSDVLIKIFVSYEVPYQIRKKILFELSKVTEWRPHLSFWIFRNFSNQA